MPVSPSQPASTYKPDKFVGLVSAGTPGSATSFIGAYLLNSSGQAVDIVRVLANSEGAAAALTGMTDETIIDTITIPAGVIGATGRLRISVNVALSTSSSNTKTVRVRLGGIAGTILGSTAWTTNTIGSMWLEMVNLNAENSQAVYGFGNRAADTVMSVLSNASAAVDTSAAVDLVITGQLASAAESITRRAYTVELINGA